ncbi:MAG TPA: DUF3552 domain-containing protein, partial [Candidatus Aerophobetes bacterium]|nr:DUF3552 domain-containing protein [Candidatus Aerophobetes bacterium]
MINLILACMLAGVIGAWVITALIARIKAKSLLGKARERLVEADEEVQKKRREIELEKKEELHRIRSAFEKDTEEKRDELRRLSKKLIQR